MTTSRPPILLAAFLAVALVFAGDAAASKIVYTCGTELCAANPDTGSSAQITTDGGQSAYRLPSISRDGRRLAAARGDVVMVGDYGGNLTGPQGGTRSMNDVAIAPDGSGVAESHSYVENRYGCPFTGGCLELVDLSATFYKRVGDPEDGTKDFEGGGGAGFLGNGALLSSRYTIDDDLYSICLIPEPGGAEDAPCVTPIASSRSLSAPAGSPDSKLIALAWGSDEPNADSSSVTLFDAASGSVVRDLAPSGSEPTFSPDGRQVAYVGPGGWIYVVPTSGGRARRVVKGVSPAWGGGDAPGPALASRSLRYGKGRIPVKLRCVGPATCRGTLRIAQGRTKLGGRSYRVKPGRSLTVRIKPTRAGQRIIARSGRQRVTVELKPRAGKAVTRRLTLRR